MCTYHLYEQNSYKNIKRLVETKFVFVDRAPCRHHRINAVHRTSPSPQYKYVRILMTHLNDSWWVPVSFVHSAMQYHPITARNQSKFAMNEWVINHSSILNKVRVILARFFLQNDLNGWGGQGRIRPKRGKLLEKSCMRFGDFVFFCVIFILFFCDFFIFYGATKSVVLPR